LTFVRFSDDRVRSKRGVRINLTTLALLRRRISRRELNMKKTLAALLAVATVAGALSATPANAQRALGAAIAGGIIGGAIVGSAVAASQAPGPVYVAPAPGPCRWVRERYWDGYDWRFRRVQYCD
jgi:fructose-specific phosphotransferase system IIC component